MVKDGKRGEKEIGQERSDSEGDQVRQREKDGRKERRDVFKDADAGRQA